MRVVFCGTPQFAVPTLSRLISAGHSIELVVTQPDRPVGRGRQTTAPPVKLLAIDAGLPVVQPERIKVNPEFEARLGEIRPDVIVVVAYGRIVHKWMLDLPSLGNINLHASLLPKYRGAAPIQWAIANGERVTGVTTMRIDAGLDTGDILLQRELPVGADRTSEDLFPLLAESGAGLMVETLDRLEPQSTRPIQPVAQKDSDASFAPLLRREDALVDFNRSAEETYNRWRGFQPWPGAYTYYRGKKLILHRVKLAEVSLAAAPPGSIIVDGDRMLVAAGEASWIELLELQAEGKKRLPVAEFLRGTAPLRAEKMGK